VAAWQRALAIIVGSAGNHGKQAPGFIGHRAQLLMNVFGPSDSSSSGSLDGQFSSGLHSCFVKP